MRNRTQAKNRSISIVFPRAYVAVDIEATRRRPVEKNPNSDKSVYAVDANRYNRRASGIEQRRHLELRGVSFELVGGDLRAQAAIRLCVYWLGWSARTVVVRSARSSLGLFDEARRLGEPTLVENGGGRHHPLHRGFPHGSPRVRHN